MSAEEVLTAFRRDAPYLFLGAAFAAVGVVSAAFAFLRRQRDSLLICFSLFAALYGLRLWVSSPMLAMIAQGATFYARLRGAVNYVTLIPALLFFISLGLPRRFERAVGYAAVGFGCLLAAPPFCSAIRPTTRESTALPSSALRDSFLFASWRAVLLGALLLRLPISV